MVGITASINYAFPYISNKIVKNPEQYSLGDTEITEEEKQNLLRVNDILTELEKQLGPLKRQSETAPAVS